MKLILNDFNKIALTTVYLNINCRAKLLFVRCDVSHLKDPNVISYRCTVPLTLMPFFCLFYILVKTLRY